MKSLKRFLNLFFIYRFFKDFVLLYPVYMLLFESKGLTVLDMSMLLVIWSITTVVFEIPTGVLADRISRKTIIVAGMSFKLVCFVLWAFAQGFLLFAAGFVFWGIQEAFCSGSTEALLYDTLKKYEQEDNYEKHSGKAGFYSGIGIAISMLVGGYAAASGFQIVLISSIASVIIATATAAAFEPDKPKKTEILKHQYIKTLKDGLLQIKNTKAVIILLLFNTLVIITPGLLEEYDQLYVERIGLSIGHIGVWGAIRTGAESLGSRLAYRLKPLFGSLNIYVLALAGGILLFVSVYFFTAYILPIYALFYFIYSVGFVLAESAMQNQIPSQTRATILSVNSLFYNLSGIAFTFIFAFAAQSFGLQAGFLCMAVYSVFMSLSFLFLKLFRNKRNVQ